jgi:hypothetical protein
LTSLVSLSHPPVSIGKINALFRQTEMYWWASELSNTWILGDPRSRIGEFSAMNWTSVD